MLFMFAIKIEYKGQETVLPVTDRLILFSMSPMPPDGRCLMDLVEFDHESGLKNIWYAGENIDSGLLVHIRVTDEDCVSRTEPVRSEPSRCSRPLTKLERFRLIEQQLKSEGWI